MRRLEFPAGTYADARPDGQHAVLNVDASGAWMSTATAMLTIPGDHRPLFVRIPRTGAFAFAGQSSNSHQTVVWTPAAEWALVDIVPCGISPVIFDDLGKLHISDCGPAVGSQGYRYVDYDTGVIVTGDATLGSDFGLAEWSYLGDGLYVGQCNLVPGCALWDGTHNRMIEAGDCFFIRAQRVGNDVALAMVKHAGEGAVCLWTTLDELRALPIIPSQDIIYPPIAPFPHAVSLAPFKDPQGTSGADSEVVIDGGTQALARPCWVGFDLDGGTTAIDTAYDEGRLVGIFAEDHGPRGYEAARTLADHLKTRVAWLHDGPDQAPLPYGLQPWDQIWLEHYLLPGETLFDARVRWQGPLLKALQSPCGDLGVVPQFYGPFDDQTTVDVIAAGLEAVYGSPRFTVVAPFEYQRVNGITGRPALEQMFARLLAASVHGVPHFVPAWPLPPIVSDNRLLYSLLKGVSMKATRVICGKTQLKASGDGFGILVHNPIEADYLGLPPAGTQLSGGPASGQVVLTVTPDGDFQCRDVNAIGSWERAKKSGGFLVYSSGDVSRWIVPYQD